MGIGNCYECGTLCVQTPNGLCPRCQQEFFEAEEKVTEHVHNNKNATIESVHEATKVKKHIIMQMIRTGRILEGELTYCCEKCGLAITSGQYCPACTTRVLEALKSSAPKAQPESGQNGSGGLYISDLLEKRG
ncbi:MAG: flagellar protein [Negativicutes bacterium]|nr:flagellar protein [Negativicutes bacterium]